MLDVEQDLIEQLRSQYDQLSPSFAKVASYLMSHYEDAAFMSASEIAQHADVSESVVVRFAAAMGFEGFPQLRRKLQKIVKAKLSPARRLADTQVNHRDPFFRSMVERDRDNLLKTLESLSEQAFDGAVKALVRAGHIYVLGFRCLANLAGILGFWLNTFLPNTRVLTCADTRLFDSLRFIQTGDVLVTFYFKRYDKRTLEAIQLARSAGAQTITITDSFLSPSARLSDVVLACQTQSGYFFNSYVSAVSMINILVSGCAREVGRERVQHMLERLDEILPDDDFVTE